ncbi:MAG: hypothetical protein K8R59_03905 [Thermoanaerobaculales bacterium]|nr:hypothetical protein [Thermoanaerobaculales bacterium]
MGASPLHIDLEIIPRQRFDAIDVVNEVGKRHGDVLNDFRKVLYCSHHTTAGYLDPSTTRRLANSRDRMTPFVESYRRLFPPDAGYRHDDMRLREELTDEERRVEPPNADAHLTFIGAGLKSCVTYEHRADNPVFFLELDGVHEGRVRRRKTTLLAYDEEKVVAEKSLIVPVTNHAIDSVNLADPRLGLIENIEELMRLHGIGYGCADVSLAADEYQSALTVNEFETLLMRHDLHEVLKDPLRFMLKQGRRILQDPRAVPAKTKGYARYDIVKVINLLMDALGLAESSVERLLARLMGYQAERMLRFKRSISLPITTDHNGAPSLVRGRYQSPILIQWRPTQKKSRELRIRLLQFR